MYVCITQVSKGAIGPSHGLVFVQDDLKRYELTVCKLTSQSESSFVFSFHQKPVFYNMFPYFQNISYDLESPNLPLDNSSSH